MHKQAARAGLSNRAQRHRVIQDQIGALLLVVNAAGKNGRRTP